MSSLPDYIPAKAPAQTVTDLSGSLSADQLSAINKIGTSLSYKARVLIMPKSYHSNDAEQLHGLSKEIATQWHVAGDRLLMVVDLNGKKIRTIAGADLKNQGITNDYMQKMVLPNYFYPYVRKGDVASALTNSLQAINARKIAFDSTTSSASANSKSSEDKAATSATSAPSATGASGSINSGGPNIAGTTGDATNYGTYYFLAALLAVAVTTYVLLNKAKKKKTETLTQALTDRLGELYKSADDLGQASDYLPPQSNLFLAQKVSAFFEKLQTLDKAKAEVEALSTARKWGKANQGLIPTLKLADSLTDEATNLLNEVNAATGGVGTAKIASAVEDPNARIKIAPADSPAASPASATDLSTKPSIRLPYTRPDWTYDNQYNQPLFFGNGYNSGMNNSGLFETMFLVNQMQEIESLRSSHGSFIDNQLTNSGGSWSGSGSNDHNSFTTDTGGSWDNNSNNNNNDNTSNQTDSGGSWGDTSSSASSFDSSDSSSSDFSSSDSSSDSGSSDSGGSW